MDIAKTLEHKCFKLGYFFQINFDNPLFLDLTGRLMSETKDSLHEWNGGADDFSFKIRDSDIKGKINIHRLWFCDDKNEWMQDHKIDKFLESCSLIADKVIQVQKPVKASRIGLRIQLLLNKSVPEYLEIYNSVYKDLLETYSNYKLSTTNIGYQFEKDDYISKISISYATRNTKDESAGPENGFLLDCDLALASETKDLLMKLDEYIEYADTEIPHLLDSSRYILGLKHATK